MESQSSFSTVHCYATNVLSVVPPRNCRQLHICLSTKRLHAQGTVAAVPCKDAVRDYSNSGAVLFPAVLVLPA